MKLKNQKGFTMIDISVSIVILTIFLSVIGNIISNVNINSQNMKKKTQATAYMAQEIEKIKATGYIENYNNKGITQEEILEEADIYDNDKKFTGYHKKITIKDYQFIKKDETKKTDILKEITVYISYRNANKDENISISTYITKE